MAKPTQLLQSIGQAVSKVSGHDQIVLTALAVFVGSIGAGGAIAFREGIGAFQFFFYGFSSELFHSNAGLLPWWRILAATTIGGLLVGLIIHHYLPARRPQGVADVIEAEMVKGGRIDHGSGLAAALVSVLTVSSGGSSGREGPVVHLAACLSAFVAEKLHLDRSLRQTLLGCGVAAGVAASFNAPIAGVFFALEVVMGSYALGAFAPVVIASVTGTIISRIYFGDYPAFTIPNHEIASFLEFPAFAILGVISAVAAISFIWSIGVARKTFCLVETPVYVRTMIGGAAIGCIGLFFPHVMGVGYEATNEALNETLPFKMLMILAILKTMATAITLGSGAGGGVFSPSLYIGAMLGGAYGIVATEVFPHLSSGHGAYTLVGMGAVAGAVLGAPISTILMVFELTGDYELTIAVMIATVIASQITQNAYGFSYFTWQLSERGVDLRGGREEVLMRNRLVADIMRNDHVVAFHNAPLEEIRAKLVGVSYGELFITDKENRLIGTVTLPDLSEVAFNDIYDNVLTAEDVIREKPPVVCVGDDLEQALDVLENAAEEHIAVVDNLETMRLLGVLHERDLLLEFHRSVREARG